ncbi:MAG: serine/threonine-protein kinase [Myxococcota bacterium]|nr:serine/threonine-protein kinase [Myxococcota bacterium]
MKKPIPFGKYYLLDRISVGGMAEVFKAKAFGVEGFERLIAVKRILPSIAEDEEFITMFIDEAKIAVQLQHANIAQIFDLGKVGDAYFIALEYVSGKDLRTIFEQLRKQGEPIPIPMAAYITMKVCEGLDYAHNKKDAAGRELNLVHRDVSPQNILVSYDGEIKIIDFGIAKAAGKAGKTQAGILKGKFGYMSPEQVRGLPLDRRSDIFSVGICLWEIVTGERLFVGESDFSTLEKVRNVEIAPPSTFNERIPEELEKIILKALSREIEDRYQSAMDFHDDLQSWMYTSGNFFARKDLGAFMHETYRAEMDEEASDIEEIGEFVRSTVPPPPKAVPRPGGDEASHTGAPPPPPRAGQTLSPPPVGKQATTPPPPPPAASKVPGAKGSISTSAPPPKPPEARKTPAVPQITGSLQPTSVPPPVPPDGIKRTMLGLPAPPLPGEMRSAPPPPPPNVTTPPPPRVTPAPPATAPSAIGMDDWDDDEPPTNIYSKEAAAEMAQAALARSAGRKDMTGPLVLGGADAGSGAAPLYPDLTAPSPAKKKTKIMPVIIGAGAVAAVLVILLAVFFLFFRGGGTLELEVTPADALRVVVDGSKVLPGNSSPFKITGLERGSHVVTVERKGYKGTQVKFDVKMTDVVKRRVTLEKSSTGFFLETDPPGASVVLNGRPIEERTPVTVTDLEPGSYMVRIVKGDAYAPTNTEIEVKEGIITKVPRKTLDLKQIEVTFQTSPGGARATLYHNRERKEIGTTPVTKLLNTDQEYKIKFSRDGYTDVVKMIEYEPGQEKMTVFATLFQSHRGTSSSRPRPKPATTTTTKPSETPRPSTTTGGEEKTTGTLSVQTRPWSKVYINGQFIKNTPLVNHPLKPGSYQVSVENPSYSIKKSYRVTIRPGKATTLVKTLI